MTSSRTERIPLQYERDGNGNADGDDLDNSTVHQTIKLIDISLIRIAKFTDLKIFTNF